ncbi:MAG TPA: 6-bladed beta-propeller, partial [Xanthobacteraceae bacterium]|nr:6-bladed beta-propeller [Xanthobacteraceae bacterium]
MTTVRTAAILLMSSLMSIPAVAQTASPPPLDYAVVADSFSLPAGMTFGSTSGVAINSKGHIFVLHRGPNPLMEFDANGKFIRALGDGLFDRPHGLRIDPQDNIWTTDARSHVVYKFSPEGRILLVLGVRDTAGEMHSYGHLRLFNEPNDMAFGSQGEIFVVQGHGRGEPKVIKFDKDGNFIKAWGKKGTG